MRIKTTSACCQIMGREERARTGEERALAALNKFKEEHPWLSSTLKPEGAVLSVDTILKAAEKLRQNELKERMPLILPGEGTKLPTETTVSTPRGLFLYPKARGGKTT